MATFGVDHLTLVREPAPDFVSKAAAVGASTLSLFLKPRRFKGAELLPALVEDAQLVRETRRRLADTGLALALVEGLLLDPDFSEDYVRRGLEVAAELGAPRASTLNFDPEENRAHDNMGRLSAWAKDAGVRVLLEFTPLSKIATLREAETWVERHGCGITLDTLHLERSGGMPSDVAGLLTRRPGAIGYVQICDGPPGPPPTMESYYREGVKHRELPGSGALPIRELLAIVGTAMPISAEVPDRRVETGELSPEAHLSRVAAAMRSVIS